MTAYAFTALVFALVSLALGLSARADRRAQRRRDRRIKRLADAAMRSNAYAPGVIVLAGASDDTRPSTPLRKERPCEPQ